MFEGRMLIVSTTKDWDAKQSAAEFPQAVKAGLSAVARYWISTVIPRHFKGGNRQRYAHSPRTPLYLQRKQRATGHRTDMVYSGRLRNEATTGSTWTADSQRAIVNIRGRVFNLKMPGKSQVDLNREMTTITKNEYAEAEKVFTDAFSKMWEKRMNAKGKNTKSNTAANPLPQETRS